MKKVFIQLLFAILPLAIAAQEKGIEFVKGTFAEALAKAKKENKNLFVDCYATWCRPCHYMSEKVFSTDSVGQHMNAGYVSFKIDMEKGEGPELQKQFKIKAYPTFIVFSPQGKELGRFAGAAPAPQFLQYVAMAAEGKDVAAFQQKELQKRIKKNEDLQKKDTIYDEGKGVQFLDISYEEALAKAKAENKRIFVDCYASWCAPCKKMLATTFKDTRIGNFMNYQFIPIKVNMEKEGDGKMLKNKFGVKVYPTYLLINPDGTLYNKFVGGAYVTAFADKLKNALLGEEDEYAKKERMQKGN